MKMSFSSTCHQEERYTNITPTPGIEPVRELHTADDRAKAIKMLLEVARVGPNNTRTIGISPTKVMNLNSNVTHTNSCLIHSTVAK
ncbi:hypothetical protein YC2023_055403 [Brassica napus]